MAFVVAIIWPISLGVRLATQSFDFQDLTGTEKITSLIVDVVPSVLKDSILTQAYQVGSEYRENIKARLGIIDFGAEIVAAQESGYLLMYGGASLEGFLQVVPRLLWPSKGQFNPEAAIQDHYGLVQYDAASTLVACGLADFGVLGALLNLALFGALFGAGKVCLAWSRVPLVGLLLVAVYFLAAYEVEADATAIFSLARYLFILFGIEMSLRILSLRKEGAGGYSTYSTRRRIR